MTDAIGLADRLNRECDCVGTDLPALRQQLDLVEVEYGEALEDRILLDDVVIDQRDRLRRVEAEVGVAVAADVEARKRPAIR